jgi:hypothetical protein
MFFFNYNVLAGKQLQPRITICFIAYSSQKEQCVLPGARKSSICAPGPEHAKKKKDVAQYANTPADVFAHSIVA